MNCHFCKKPSQTEVKIHDENGKYKETKKIDTPICDDCLKIIWGHSRSTLNPKWGEGWKRDKKITVGQVKTLLHHYQNFDWDYEFPLEKRKIFEKNTRHEIKFVLDRTEDFEVKEWYPCSNCDDKCFVHDRFQTFYELLHGDGELNKKQVYATKTIALLEFIRNYQGKFYKYKDEIFKPYSEIENNTIVPMEISKVMIIPPQQLGRLWNPRIEENGNGEEYLEAYGRRWETKTSGGNGVKKISIKIDDDIYEMIDNWPGHNEYDVAIKNHHKTFPPEYKNGDFVLQNVHPIPIREVGGFAIAYKFKKNDDDELAIRVFQEKGFSKKRGERFKKISKFFQDENILEKIPSLVSFQFKSEAITLKNIRIKDKNGSIETKSEIKFPLIEMQWVKGQNMGNYINKIFDDKQKMIQLSEKIRIVFSDLENNGVSHGDIAPENIIITPKEEIKLIDYDGFFIPQFRGDSPVEEGHTEFQHHNRGNSNIKDYPVYDEKLDRFSALVTYLSLKAIAYDPSFKNFIDNDKVLCFTKEDFMKIKNGEKPEIIIELEKTKDGLICDLTDELIKSCKEDRPNIRSLEEIINSV